MKAAGAFKQQQLHLEANKGVHWRILPHSGTQQKEGWQGTVRNDDCGKRIALNVKCFYLLKPS